MGILHADYEFVIDLLQLFEYLEVLLMSFSIFVLLEDFQSVAVNPAKFTPGHTWWPDWTWWLSTTSATATATSE